MDPLHLTYLIFKTAASFLTRPAFIQILLAGWRRPKTDSTTTALLDSEGIVTQLPHNLQRVIEKRFTGMVNLARRDIERVEPNAGRRTTRARRIASDAVRAAATEHLMGRVKKRRFVNELERQLLLRIIEVLRSE
jgi:hypothetical protein